jgi:ribosomal protein L40E
LKDLLPPLTTEEAQWVYDALAEERPPSTKQRKSKLPSQKVCGKCDALNYNAAKRCLKCKALFPTPENLRAGGAAPPPKQEAQPAPAGGRKRRRKACRTCHTLHYNATKKCQACGSAFPTPENMGVKRMRTSG